MKEFIRNECRKTMRECCLLKDSELLPPQVGRGSGEGQLLEPRSERAAWQCWDLCSVMGDKWHPWSLLREKKQGFSPALPQALTSNPLTFCWLIPARTQGRGGHLDSLCCSGSRWQRVESGPVEGQ